jgi:ABC-type sugar transport system ATPase subunit
MNKHLLEMKNICKSFPGVKAVDMVDLYLHKGEVLALVGENGAGKSTLMKILSGAYKQDSGDIIIDETAVDTDKYTPLKSIELGVSVIYQELNYLSTVSIAENIFIGRLPKKRSGIIDYKKLASESIIIQKELGLELLDPFQEVSGLLVAQKQLLEVARAFVRNSKIIVMDEPTASLTDKEIEQLYTIIRKYKNQGGAVIFISHKLDEIFNICDSIMVMRDGKKVMQSPIQNETKNSIIAAMVGRELKNMYPIEIRDIKEPILEINNLSTDFLKNISFHVSAGEIVGLYGLLGAGCENITQCIYGIEKYKTGTFRVNGKLLDFSSPSRCLKAGIAYVPSERKSGGMLLNMPVRANITLSTLRNISKRGMLHLREEIKVSKEWIKTLGIKTPNVDTDAELLSGGNQQKVVFAKCLNVHPNVILMNEPTRGVDVGAKAEIYKLMEVFCNEGLGILMVSSEMPETLAICDRILVIHNGTISMEFQRGEYDQMSIMKAMLGEYHGGT